MDATIETAKNHVQAARQVLIDTLAEYNPIDTPYTETLRQVLKRLDAAMFKFQIYEASKSMTL